MQIGHHTEKIIPKPDENAHLLINYTDVHTHLKINFTMAVQIKNTCIFLKDNNF
jgi:hypothetical protein